MRTVEISSIAIPLQSNTFFIDKYGRYNLNITGLGISLFSDDTNGRWSDMSIFYGCLMDIAKSDCRDDKERRHLTS